MVVKLKRDSFVRSICFGFCTCTIGLIVGVFIRVSAIGDYSEFPYHATSASFLAPTLSWLLIVEKGKNYSKKRGITAGVIGIIIAHYLCWYSLLVVSNIQYHMFGMKIGSLGGPPIDPLSGLIAVLLYTVISYLVVGWITIPAGAFVGCFFPII